MTGQIAGGDTEPQTAGGKVLWHFTMSLDGFVAGPNRLHRVGEGDPASAVNVRYRSTAGIEPDSDN